MKDKDNKIEIKLGDNVEFALCTLAGNSKRLIDLLDFFKTEYKARYFDYSGKRIQLPQIIETEPGSDYSNELHLLISEIKRINTQLSTNGKTIAKRLNPPAPVINKNEIKDLINEQICKVVNVLSDGPVKWETEKKPKKPKK